MYKVLAVFADVQDNNHIYDVGEAFPREGVSVSEERLAELAGSNNRLRKPLIVKVAEEAPKKAPAKKTGKAAAK